MFVCEETAACPKIQLSTPERSCRVKCADKKHNPLLRYPLGKSIWVEVQAWQKNGFK